MSSLYDVSYRLWWQIAVGITRFLSNVNKRSIDHDDVYSNAAQGVRGSERKSGSKEWETERDRRRECEMQMARESER